MPGVTGKMFEWWMGWHTQEHQRYKLWHPRAHVANGTREMRSDDPGVSDKDKYMTTHYVTEYIAGHCDRIKITFFDPRRFFGDSADLAANGTTAMVCGRVDLQTAPITVGWLIHQIRESDTGTEMRSRFWLGAPQISGSRRNDPRNWFLRTRLFQSLALPKNLATEMVVHCGMEMNHLAGFLPDLYALYNPD
ncbi:unnamed protein product, partial [Ectocarpus sp. 12 AP-2014]